MTISDFKLDIQKFKSNSERLICEVLFILNKDDTKEIKFADIESDAQQELKGDFLDHLEETILNNTDLRITEISRMDERKNFLFKYDYDEKPDTFSIFDIIKTQVDYDNFSFSSDNLDQISGVVFVMKIDDLTLISYKHNYPINLYKRDSKAMGLWKSEERLVQIPGDILKIYPDFDFLYINDDLFIRNTRVLEKYFGFEKIINKKANETIELIKTADIVEDTSFLEDRISDLTFSRKLAQIGTHSIVLNNLTFDEIAQFIDNFQPLRGKFHFNEEHSKLVLATKKSQNLFLKLLNDDFLTSMLTKINYDSANKDLVDA